MRTLVVYSGEERASSQGGISLHLNSGLGATIGGSSTFTREEARDFTFNAELSFTF